jgi:3-deoxy-D-manno-octulosonate 8-phosphate phosphatase (KDO 8-P phosphatase)
MLEPSYYLELACHIRLLVLDVDGVMSDGKLYFTDQGVELKAFNSLDGQGIKMLQRSGVKVAIITGRQSSIVAKRAQDLNIESLIQGREDKLVALSEMIARMDLHLHQVAYMGDDLPDLPAIRKVGLGITVPNASPELKQHVAFCTRRQGGDGAVREVCELLMQAQNTWSEQLAVYLKSDLP